MKMLSDTLHARVLGINPVDYNQTIRPHRLELGELYQADDPSQIVELPIPDYLGEVSEVFRKVSSPWIKLEARIRSVIDTRADYPLPARYPVLPGWWEWLGGKWCQVSQPPQGDYCLDFETTPVPGSKGVWVPFMAVALGPEGLYFWCWDPDSPVSVVPWEKGDQVILGWNVSYDRQFLGCEYLLEPSGIRWFDLMSCYIAIRGMSNQQRAAWALLKYQPNRPDWVDQTSPQSLSMVYQFYTGKPLSKETRDGFVKIGKDFIKSEGLTEEPRHYIGREWQAIASYCHSDVISTNVCGRHILPEWLGAIPSNVSRLSHILLGSPWVPLSTERYPGFYDRVDDLRILESMDMAGRVREVAQHLLEDSGYLGIQTLRPSGKSYLALGLDTLDDWLQGLDPQLQELDWGNITTGANKGKPRWYPDLLKNPKAGTRLGVYVTGVRYRGNPVLWEATSSRSGFWKTSEGPIEDPSDPGEPLKTIYTKETAKIGELFSTDRGAKAEELMGLLIRWSTWISMRKRIYAVHTEAPEGYPVSLPGIAATGTITRRCADGLWQVLPNPKKNKPGTEFKSMIEAPQGYLIVGADVASEELWLAAILGDTLRGVLGATKLSVMVHIGQKTDSPLTSTDPHSVLAREQNISRDQAKTVWYGLIYGLGVTGLLNSLARSLPGVSKLILEALARTIIDGSKGKYDRDLRAYVGGLASPTFTALKRIADGPAPRSPVLGARLTRSLSGNKDYGTSRGNWVVQTSASDFRDLMVVLVNYLVKKEGLEARLIMTIHDEFRYLVKQGQETQMAWILQVAHLYTRAYITQALGFVHLPAGSSWFPEVDIDTVLRKDPKAPCETPTQKALGPSYNLTPEDLRCKLEQCKTNSEPLCPGCP
jgi:DNA polymerase gamma 1